MHRMMGALLSSCLGFQKNFQKKANWPLFFVASKVDLALQGCRIGTDKYELPHSESFNLV